MKQYWSMTEGVFNCLVDSRRTRAFARAVRNTVNPDSVVVDLGSGSGIMALFAAKAGAKKVFAVEHDDNNAKWLERTFAANGYGKVIEVVQADARELVLPRKVDLIICEMIATGLIEELQIPVMNQALLSAKKGARVILESMENYIEAVEVDDRFYGFTLPVPQYCYPGEHSVRVKALTPKHLYRAVNFTKPADTQVELATELPVTLAKSGGGEPSTVFVSAIEPCSVTVQPSGRLAPIVTPLSCRFRRYPSRRATPSQLSCVTTCARAFLR